MCRLGSYEGIQRGLLIFEATTPRTRYSPRSSRMMSPVSTGVGTCTLPRSSSVMSWTRIGTPSASGIVPRGGRTNSEKVGLARSGPSRQSRAPPITCRSCDVWRQAMVRPWRSSSSSSPLGASWRRQCRHTSAFRIARRKRLPKATCLPLCGQRRRTDRIMVHTPAWIRLTCSRSTHASRRPWPLSLHSAAGTASPTPLAGEAGASRAPIEETPHSWRTPPAPESRGGPNQVRV